MQWSANSIGYGSLDTYQMRTKVKGYEALVIPVFMYDSECWISKKYDERKNSVIEMAG